MNALLMSARRSLALVAFVATVVGIAPTARADAIYGVGVDNNIYYVDPVSQNIAFVGPSLSTGSKANGFATDRSRNQLLYFGSNGDLYYYDIPTGNSGTVATAAVMGTVDDFPPEDATFFDDAFWFIGKGGRVEDFDNRLYKAQITYTGGMPSFTGGLTSYQLTASGSSTGMAFGDIAINPLTNMLYGSTIPSSGGLFFSLDMTSLSAVADNAVTVISSGNSLSLQLAFSGDYSTLYGQRYVVDPTDPTNPAATTGVWYTVNIGTGEYNAAGFTTAPGMRDVGGFGTVVPEVDLGLFGCGVSLLAGSLCLFERRRRPHGIA